jgi:hypothetical protein
MADDPAPPAVSPPVWNCTATTSNCLRDATVDPAAFAAAVVDVVALPVVVYPLPGSVHPVNLPHLTVQWTRPAGAAQKAFQIHVQSSTKPGNAYDFFVPYRAPAPLSAPSPAESAVYEIPEPAWRWIASQNAGTEVQITVAGYDPAANKIATSAPIAIAFSAAPVEGGLFFLATEAKSTILRQVFGSAGAPQPLVPIPVAGVPGLDCAGCHSVSRDGHEVAFSATYAGDLTVAATLDIDHPTIAQTSQPPPDNSDAVAPALSPDGQLIFARSVAGDVWLRDTHGAVIDSKKPADVGGRIDYPEWSPTRREIVASRAEGAVQPAEPYAANDGRIVVIPIDAAAGGRGIGQPAVIASPGPDRTYGNPAFSPDGKWIAFVSRPAHQSSHANPATRLHLINRDEPDHVVDLGLATGNADSGSTYPKFAPVPHDHCRRFFLTFQSRRDYGVIRVASLTGNTEWPQLWMTAIDLDKAGDPSSPPLWLPFQDVTNKNLLPSWSAQIACNDATPCGAGAACVSGHCVVSPN